MSNNPVERFPYVEVVLNDKLLKVDPALGPISAACIYMVYYVRFVSTTASDSVCASLPWTLTTAAMSMLNKFRKGAEKAGLQASAFLNSAGTRVASESKGFVQGFSLPGEAEKAAKILQSFLGE